MRLEDAARGVVRIAVRVVLGVGLILGVLVERRYVDLLLDSPHALRLLEVAEDVAVGGALLGCECESGNVQRERGGGGRGRVELREEIVDHGILLSNLFAKNLADAAERYK